jgi:hypothetical protein
MRISNAIARRRGGQSDPATVPGVSPFSIVVGLSTLHKQLASTALPIFSRLTWPIEELSAVATMIGVA